MKYIRQIFILSLIFVFALWPAIVLIDSIFPNYNNAQSVLIFHTMSRRFFLLPFFMVAVFSLFGVLLTRVISKRIVHPAEQGEGLAAIIQGRTDRNRIRTEEELRKSERFLSTIFDSIHDPFRIINRSYRIIKANEAYARMKGKAAEDLPGRPCYDVLYNRSVTCEACVVEKTFRSSNPCAQEKLVMTPEGMKAWMEIYTYPVFNEKHEVTHVIEYARDITDRKTMEEEKERLINKLNLLSTTDSLTGLLNRRALNDILEHEIDRASRYLTDLSLIICDIDRFKQINDAHGHTAGDLALQTISETFKSVLRKADLLGRYGGDEFMIILPETSLTGAKNLAEKIRAAVADAEFRIPEGKAIRLSISIGVASCCTPVENIDTLVARADSALYAAKQAGRNMVSVVAH